MTDMSGNGGDRQKTLEEFGDRQYMAEEGMRRSVSEINSAGLKFARFANSYIEERLWEKDYDSLKEALAQPGIRVSESHAKNLALVYRALVLDRKVPMEDLDGVDLRNVQIGLPAITDTDHPRYPAQIVDVVGDARSLSRFDMAERYTRRRLTRGSDDSLDATQEPERMPCPMCGSFVESDRIPEDERRAA